MKNNTIGEKSKKVKRITMRTSSIGERSLKLTGVFTQDPVSKHYTAFFVQLPDILSHGKNLTEAKKNLWKTVQGVFNFIAKKSNF